MIKESFLYFLLAFAQQYSGYQMPVDDSAPKIEYKIHETIKGEKCDLDWQAYTSFSTGTITLRSDWNDKEPDDVCALAHELTHWLQYKNHKIYGNVESPAYHVSEMCYKKIYHNHPSTKWAHDQVKFFKNHQECQ